MPTTGIQRLPAIIGRIGLTKAATNRTARRARGPRLMALVVLLIQPGRATGRQCDVGLGCHIPGPCPVLLYVASLVRESNERFTDAWTNHHRFLLDVAYRLLGSYSDAEDLVQEAFSRLLRTDLDPIEDVRAWLVVVVSRLCLDQLRSARVTRDAYVSPWFPEPLLFSDDASIDPADVQTIDENVHFDLLLVLARISPAERLVFV